MPQTPKRRLIAWTPDDTLSREMEQFVAEHFELIHAPSAPRALAMLLADPAIESVVAHHVAGNPGMTLLAAAQQRRPEVRRVLATASDDLLVSINALHSGVADKLLHLPMTRDALLAALLPPVNALDATNPAARTSWT